MRYIIQPLGCLPLGATGVENGKYVGAALAESPWHALELYCKSIGGNRRGWSVALNAQGETVIMDSSGAPVAYVHEQPEDGQ